LHPERGEIELSAQQTARKFAEMALSDEVDRLSVS
jgi:hypothetical protein